MTGISWCGLRRTIGEVNTPADRHWSGATLSFADGHVELWRWQWRATVFNAIAVLVSGRERV